MTALGSRRLVWGTAVVIAFMTACGQRESEFSGDVAARMKGRVIHDEEFEERLGSLPPDVRRLNFSGARGRMRFLDQMIDQELMVRAAEQMGLDQDPEISRQLREYRKNLLVQAYERNLIESLPQPTEEEIRRYYDEHRDEFIVPARVNASWIQCATKEECEKARRRIVEDGEEFGAVARRVSIHEETAKDGGLLGYFSTSGYVHGIGQRHDFSKHAFVLEVGDVGPVFEYEGAWGFIKIHEKAVERDLPFEQAKRRIELRLRPTPTDSLRAADIARLRRENDVQTFMDLASELEGKTAIELMRMASEAADANDKIDYYETLLEQYPHFVRADEAQFMIAFLLSESLDNPKQAIFEFQKVLDRYPNSELRESAAYMVQSLRDTPLSETAPAPAETFKDGPDPVPGPDSR